MSTEDTREALVCPRCRNLTRERTSTGNGFCRPCDNIFGRTVQALREWVPREDREATVDCLPAKYRAEARRLLKLEDTP